MDRCRCAFLVLLLAGCGARTPVDGSQSDGVVRGTVIDEVGRPIAGARVRIDTTITATDEQGRFSAPAPAIYDAAIVLYRNGIAGGTDHDAAASVYQGMSGRDPVFQPRDRYVLSLPKRADVVIAAPPSPSPSVGWAEFVAFRGDSRFIYSYGHPSRDTRSYTLLWPDFQTIGLDLYAFQYETDPTTDAPLRYLAFDKLERSLSPGDQVDWTVDWKPMPYRETTIRATVGRPDGYEIWRTSLAVHLPSSIFPASFLEGQHRGPDVSFVVPDLPGATYSLSVEASNGAGNTDRTVDLLTPASPAAVELEAIPRAISPPEGASGVGVGTEFTWENPAHGVSFIVLRPSGSSNLASYQIFTNGTSMRIPDLSDLGLAFPRQAEYVWAAFVATSDSVDQLAAQGFQNNDLRERTYAYSEYRKMTTR